MLIVDLNPNKYELQYNVEDSSFDIESRFIKCDNIYNRNTERVKPAMVERSKKFERQRAIRKKKQTFVMEVGRKSENCIIFGWLILSKFTKFDSYSVSNELSRLNKCTTFITQSTSMIKLGFGLQNKPNGLLRYQGCFKV